MFQTPEGRGTHVTNFIRLWMGNTGAYRHTKQCIYIEIRLRDTRKETLPQFYILHPNPSPFIIKQKNGEIQELWGAEIT